MTRNLLQDALPRDGFRQLEAFLPAGHAQFQDGWAVEGGLAPGAIATGFAALDQRTGGLRAGTLTVVGGRPCMGTTAFALDVVRHVALTSGRDVAIVSLDLAGNRIARRLQSAISRVNIFKLKTGILDAIEQQRLIEATDRLNRAPIYIDDATFDLSAIEDKLGAWASKAEEPGLIIIDKLQILAPGMEWNKRTAHVVGRIKLIAQQLEIPVLLTSRLSRKIEKRKDKSPMFGDVPHPVITEGADIILSIYREGPYSGELGDDSARVSVMHNRHGLVGSVQMRYRAEFCVFENDAMGQV